MEARRRHREERRASDVSGVPPLAGIGSVLTRNWRVVAPRGGFSVLFGVLALLWPAITFVALVLLFGAYAFVDGIFALVAAFSRATAEAGQRLLVLERAAGRWLLVLEGVVGIGAGLVTLFLPGVTAAVLVGVIAAWAVASGLAKIVEAVRLRKAIEGEWLLGLAGVSSMVFGVLVLLFPTALEAHKQRAAESRAKPERHLRGARHEAEAKVAEWKANREVKELEARADDAEQCAETALDVARDAAEEASAAPFLVRSARLAREALLLHGAAAGALRLSTSPAMSW